MCIGIALEVAGGMPVTLALVLFMPLSAFGVGIWIRQQIDTKRRTRAGNIGFTVVVIVIMEIVLLGGMFFAIMNISSAFNMESIDNRPVLTLSDVGAYAPSNHSYSRVNGTLAIPVDYEHWESNREGSVSTQIYRTVSTTLARWLYNHFADEFTRQFTRRSSDLPGEAIIVLSSDEAAYWGAERGMRFIYGNSDAVELLLWNNKTILRLSAESVSMDLDTVNQAVRRLWE
jgi:hypothetical protein